MSFARGEVELGFQPQYSIKEMVAEVMQHRPDYGDFEREEFYNIRVFKKLAAESVSV